jgi:hypothetical protein
MWTPAAACRCLTPSDRECTQRLKPCSTPARFLQVDPLSGWQVLNAAGQQVYPVSSGYISTAQVSPFNTTVRFLILVGQSPPAHN